MLSKWTPWDYARNHSNFVPDSVKLSAYYCYDSFVEKVLYARFLASNSNSIPHAVLGPEVTPEWIEENILGSDLFGEPASYRVLHAETMPAKSKKYLLDNKIIPEMGSLIFSFSSDDKFLLEFSKIQDGHFFKIPAIPFWFTDKLLEFFSDGMGIRLPWDVKQYLLTCLEPDGAEFATALKQIALAMPISEINLEKVKEVIAVKRLDQFALAETFCKKDFTSFYRFFLSENRFENLGHENLRMFFAFMQSHLLKIANPSYIDAKPKPSQYDKTIQSFSKTWQLNDLRRYISVFSEYELQAKMKSNFLLDQMRRDYLSYL